MWARFTVLNETPIDSAIAGCVIPLSRSNTIWMRSRCAAGIFHRRAVFSCRICFLVHLTIRPPESDGQSESYYQLECEPENTANPRFKQLWKRYEIARDGRGGIAQISDCACRPFAKICETRGAHCAFASSMTKSLCSSVAAGEVRQGR